MSFMLGVLERERNGLLEFEDGDVSYGEVAAV